VTTTIDRSTPGDLEGRLGGDAVVLDTNREFRVVAFDDGGTPALLWDERAWSDRLRLATAPEVPAELLRLAATDADAIGSSPVWTVRFTDATERATFLASYRWTDPIAAGLGPPSPAAASDGRKTGRDVVALADQIPTATELFGPDPLPARFADALAFAAFAHADQVRKGDNGSVPKPYLPHPMRVAARVLANGGETDQAIAALLHDAVEDHGGVPMLELIEQRFGPGVAAIVRSCTDSFTDDPEDKESWFERKVRHIGHLCAASGATADSRGVIVTAGDKLDNTTQMVDDVSAIGPVVWARFKGGRTGTVWYARAMQRAIATHDIVPAMVDELGATIDRLARLAGDDAIERTAAPR